MLAKPFDLKAKIVDLAYGEIDDNMQIGLVTEDALDTIHFVDLNGIQSEPDFKDPVLGNIKQVLIVNQMMYVLSESGIIGLYKIYN